MCLQVLSKSQRFMWVPTAHANDAAKHTAQLQGPAPGPATVNTSPNTLQTFAPALPPLHLTRPDPAKAPAEPEALGNGFGCGGPSRVLPQGADTPGINAAQQGAAQGTVQRAAQVNAGPAYSKGAPRLTGAHASTNKPARRNTRQSAKAARAAEAAQASQDTQAVHDPVAQQAEHSQAAGVQTLQGTDATEEMGYGPQPAVPAPVLTFRGNNRVVIRVVRPGVQQPAAAAAAGSAAGLDDIYPVSNAAEQPTAARSAGGEAQPTKNTPRALKGELLGEQQGSRGTASPVQPRGPQAPSQAAKRAAATEAAPVRPAGGIQADGAAGANAARQPGRGPAAAPPAVQPPEAAPHAGYAAAGVRPQPPMTTAPPQGTGAAPRGARRSPPVQNAQQGAAMGTAWSAQQAAPIRRVNMRQSGVSAMMSGPIVSDLFEGESPPRLLVLRHTRRHTHTCHVCMCMEATYRGKTHTRQTACVLYYLCYPAGEPRHGIMFKRALPRQQSKFSSLCRREQEGTAAASNVAAPGGQVAQQPLPAAVGNPAQGAVISNGALTAALDTLNMNALRAA